MPRNTLCTNDSDNFCYVCGKYTTIKERLSITDYIKGIYKEYFSIGISHQEKSWVPHKVCKSCHSLLVKWKKGNCDRIPFGSQMIWREPHLTDGDCYFCTTDVRRFNNKNKKAIKYPEVPFATKPIAHGPNLPISPLPIQMKVPESSLHFDNENSDILPDNESYTTDDVKPQPLMQSELNDLVRDFNLSKEFAEVLGSRLQEKNLLAVGTSFSWYRHRENEFLPFFAKKDSLVYCKNVPKLMNMGLILQINFTYLLTPLNEV